jgi:hypothetical protein
LNFRLMWLSRMEKHARYLPVNLPPLFFSTLLLPSLLAKTDSEIYSCSKLRLRDDEPS